MLERRTNSPSKFRKTKEQWIEKAIVRYKARHYKDALRACNNAIQLDPNYARAYYGKGLILTRLEIYDEALASYEKARQLGLKFDMGELVHKIGELLYQAKDYGRAGIFFERAIAIDRKYKKSYHTRTGVLLEEVDNCYSRGDINDAWAKLKEASLFNPHDDRVLSTITKLEKERYASMHQTQPDQYEHKQNNRDKSSHGGSVSFMHYGSSPIQDGNTYIISKKPVHPFNCTCHECYEP